MSDLMEIANDRVEEALLDKEAAASFFLTSPRHIESLVEKGELAFCRVGRYLRFRRTDLEDYLVRTHVPARRSA